jgi:hypothetical protein
VRASSGYNRADSAADGRRTARPPDVLTVEEKSWRETGTATPHKGDPRCPQHHPRHVVAGVGSLWRLVRSTATMARFWGREMRSVMPTPVKNTSDMPFQTMGPEPGFTYVQGQTYFTQQYAFDPGKWRWRSAQPASMPPTCPTVGVSAATLHPALARQSPVTSKSLRTSRPPVFGRRSSTSRVPSCRPGP